MTEGGKGKSRIIKIKCSAMYEGDGETSWLTTLLQFVECAGPVIKCRTVNNKDTGNSRRKKKKRDMNVCMQRL